MNGFPTELIYGLVFAAIVLFPYLLKRFAQPQQQDSAQQERLAQIPEEVKETPAASSLSSVAVSQFGRAEAPKDFSVLPGRRFAKESLMGTRREVQNAIVIATIVGPCRAFEPHHVR